MVQLFNYHEYAWQSANDYWKLDSGNLLRSHGLRTKLRESNFPVLKSVNNTRLRALYVRCQRGLLSFEGMPVHDLKFYAAQRGLTVAFTATPNSIKAQLEQVDEDATFNRFTDLPPEIRQMVYQHYFDYSLANRRPKHKYQPPLTKVSHMIRRESLPLFYDCLHIEMISMGPLTSPYKFQPSTTTARLLRSTASQNLARIKSFRLYFVEFSAGMAIDLRNQDPITSVEVYRAGWPGMLEAAGQARYKTLLAALRTLALSMAARPGLLRFQLSDVEDVGETMRIVIDETERQ